SPEAALPIVTGMAAALTAAHRAGVVHRDFKPDNVMLATGGPDGERIVVTDFGLARNNVPTTHDSVQGRGLEGTLAYMAPEQLEGHSARQPADIYALGLVMYEMLTGQLPFAPAADGGWLAAAWRRAVEPIPPVRTIVPGIDARWSDAVERCLQRDVARRTGSADEVVRAVAGEPTGDVPSNPGRIEDPPAAEAVPARAPRRIWPSVVIAGVGAAAVLIAAMASHRRMPAPPATRARPAIESPRPAAVVAPKIEDKTPEKSADLPPPPAVVPEAPVSARAPAPPRVAHHERAARPAPE